MVRPPPPQHPQAERTPPLPGPPSCSPRKQAQRAMAVGARFGAWFPSGVCSLPLETRKLGLSGPSEACAKGGGSRRGGHAACCPARKAQPGAHRQTLLFLLRAEARAGMSWSLRPPLPQWRELRGASPPKPGSRRLPSQTHTLGDRGVLHGEGEGPGGGCLWVRKRPHRTPGASPEPRLRLCVGLWSGAGTARGPGLQGQGATLLCQDRLIWGHTERCCMSPRWNGHSTSRRTD